MSDVQNHPDNEPRDSDAGPGVFVDAPEELTGNPRKGGAGLAGRNPTKTAEVF